MKALTIKQPWAECIAAGVKTVENRSWNTNYRGPLLIHAGLGWCKRGAEFPLVRRTLRCSGPLGTSGAGAGRRRGMQGIGRQLERAGRECKPG